MNYKTAQSVLGKFIYFFAYEFMKMGYERYSGKKMGIAANVAIAYFAEAAHFPLTMPLEGIVTRLQTSTKTGTKLGFFETIQSIINESGIQGLYKGSNTYQYLCLQPCIQYTVYEQIKRLLLRGDHQSISGLHAFLLGALARAVGLIATYPFIRAKTVMQAETSKTKAKGSILTYLLLIAQKDGISALFAGLGPELLRAMLSSALMLMIKERVHSGSKTAILKMVRSSSGGNIPVIVHKS